MKHNYKQIPTHILKPQYHAGKQQMLNILEKNNMQLQQSILKQLADNPLIRVEQKTIFSNLDHDIFDFLSNQPSLKEHLYFQLHTVSKPYHEKICTYIIESLNDHGFLEEDFAQAKKVLSCSQEQWENSLRLIQSFDPCGVAAKNSIDALIIQSQYAQDVLAISLLRHYQKEIQTNDLVHIAKKEHCSLQDVSDALKRLQHRHPYPCSAFSNHSNYEIIADLEIKVEDEHIYVKPVDLFQISYIEEDPSLLTDNPVLKQYFKEAKTIVHNINQRNVTLMLVANELIKKQQGYFLYHDELLPLTQQEIAENLKIHQSTISRTLKNKYYIFENKVSPLSNLLSSHTFFGDSKDAIQKAILEIIKEENHSHPYSDEELTKQLYQYDLRVSRRTVVKYRQQLHIPNSYERKQSY